MKLFCITKHFDKNAKLWSQGEVLETGEGDQSFTKEYFATGLPHHMAAKDEPEKRAYSSMIQEKAVDFVTAMKMSQGIPVNSPEPAPEPVAAKVEQPKAVKRGK